MKTYCKHYQPKRTTVYEGVWKNLIQLTKGIVTLETHRRFVLFRQKYNVEKLGFAEAYKIAIDTPKEELPRIVFKVK